MRINKKHAAVVLMIMFFAVSCGNKKEAAIEDISRPVKVKILENSDISLGYTASGVIKGIEEIPYTATSDGKVTVVNAKNGDLVSTGQIIIAIDNQAARSNVTSASASYNQARINFEKYSQLYAKRLVTETEYLNAKTAMESARSNLEIANDTNSKSVISANRNGVIANMSLEKYQEVSSGDSLFTLINESEMKLEVGVSPKIVEKIKIGTEAKIKIDELDKELTGSVYEISASADTSTRQFIVKVKIPNPAKEIKSGMYGTVSIDTGVEEGIIIPKKSIVVRGVEQIIYIVKDGNATPVRIKILNQNQEFAAVIGEGLSVGAQLIIDGQIVVQASEKVRIVE